jgi:alpha-L-fucosidase
VKKAKAYQDPLAPEQYRKPDGYQAPKYKYSLQELKEKFSEDMMKKAAEVDAVVTKVNEEGKWKPTAQSIELHQAPEWFLDGKFGMFIDWGLWSIAGWAPKVEKGAMYPDWYEFKLDREPSFRPYHEKNWGADFKRDDFIPLFQARDYQPEKLAEIAKQAGMKYVVPFAKHHGGFCLWPSSFTQRNSVEMGPKRI